MKEKEEKILIEVIDFSSWNEYEGTAEGSGRSEKIWLKSLDGRIGLFKFPKIDPVDGIVQYNNC